MGLASAKLRARLRTHAAAKAKLWFIPLGIAILAWEQVAGAEVTDGEVRIFRRGEPAAWLKVRYGAIHNARPLLLLIASRTVAEPS